MFTPHSRPCIRQLKWTLASLLLVAPLAQAQTATRSAEKTLNSCHIYEVKDLPGSHSFANSFIEAFATDPSGNNGTLYALTADLGGSVPESSRALYISKSTNGGITWREVTRIGLEYLEPEISEGLRNGLAVSPNGDDFVVTTQKGAFQVTPHASGAVITPIDGPRVPHDRPHVTIAKKDGDPVRAGVVQMTADGRHMVIGYGYFDDDPQLITYQRTADSSWAKDGTLPHLPTNLDIFSMQLSDPDSLYVGTGDQAYHLNLRTKQWNRVAGVGPDSAIHSMCIVKGGLHFAACWGVYNPINADEVTRITTARFLLHRGKDEVGPNIRAYAVVVDPQRPSHQVLSAITGVYASNDSGVTWRRLNDLPEGEFHTAHINPDGTAIVSGFIGTFVVNPFFSACSPHLKTREK